jgi:hypothetical protein
MVIGRRVKLVAVLAMFAGSSMATAASAAIAPVDPGKVKALAIQIEATLSSQGCGADAQADVSAIQATIAASGDDPWVARAALHIAQSSPAAANCPTLAAALASVDQTIDQALQGNSVPHAGGGPGGGTPIGAPASYVSGGGSDYLPQ